RLTRPAGLADGHCQRPANIFRRIAAALGLIAHERGVDLVEIVGERQELRDIVVAAIPVCDQAYADLASALILQDFIHDSPYLLLGALEEAAHGAGCVQSEDHLQRLLARNGRPGGWRLLSSQILRCWLLWTRMLQVPRSEQN